MGDPGELRRRRLAFLRKRRAPKNPEMTMMEHLDELRSRLIISAVAFLAFSVVAFILFGSISDFLLGPLCSLPPERLGPQGCRLPVTGVTEPFTVRLKVTALTAFVLSAPFWLYQLWGFVTPGLTVREKRYALPFVLSSVIFFVLGATFAYLTLPLGLRVLIQMGGPNIVPFFTASEYINFVGLIFIVFGVTFELPLVLFFLGLAGVIKVEQLQRFRRGAIVGIALLAAIVTPSQDPYTMLIMAGPIYLLYEATILALRAVSRRRARNPE